MQFISVYVIDVNCVKKTLLDPKALLATRKKCTKNEADALFIFVHFHTHNLTFPTISVPVPFHLFFVFPNKNFAQIDLIVLFRVQPEIMHVLNEETIFHQEQKSGAE